MKGEKGSPQSQWIKDYLKFIGIDISSWKEYQRYYNMYRARCLKYNPENYEQFMNLCTFPKQRQKSCKVKEPKPRPLNEEGWLKDQKKEWEEYKIRMKWYREDKIRRPVEKGKEKDRMPYLFKFAIRCLAGVYPIECFPETLNEYKKELENYLK